MAPRLATSPVVRLVRSAIRPVTQGPVATPSRFTTSRADPITVARESAGAIS